jgi:A/G-specific adenine glycosylase
MSSRRLPTFSDSIRQTFRPRLLAWYDGHARDLPWRETRDPYRVWLSEIMLQQTRVAAVIAHYHEFLRRFPTIEKLAAAREASVLAAWSGLGYYRRARMLHAAAKVIVRELEGKFPATADEWLELPGIGRYTAAAIASIAFGQAVAVVDGNVERVLQRLSGRQLVGEQLWDAAAELLDSRRDATRPGDFNQAMMELGATLCMPRAPACLACPVTKLCVSRGELPGQPKSTRQKKREIHYMLDCRDGSVFLVQRPRDARLMAGMWELPEAVPDSCHSDSAHPPHSCHSEGSQSEPEEPAFLPRRGTNAKPYFTLRHSITVTNYKVQVWRANAAAEVRGEWFAVDRLPRIALTGLARKILRKAEML